MKVNEWAAELSTLSYNQADVLLEAFDTIDHHLPDFAKEFEGFDILREMTWVYVDALAKKNEELAHSCTCGGNCKSSPEILCFSCKKTTFLPVVPEDSHPDGNSWLFAHASECGEIVRGRLYTKCDKYEPREVKE